MKKGRRDAGLRFGADVKKFGGAVVWSFPVQPVTDQPFYATTVLIDARNTASVAQDITGVVVAGLFCSANRGVAARSCSSISERRGRATSWTRST